MINVVFLGYGNVNSHLLEAFHQCDNISVLQVFNRNYIKLTAPIETIPVTDDLGKIMEADVYVIGISDDAIQTFSESLPFQNKLVVHTSGGVSMEALSSKNRRGVFYPLQTFSKQREVDFTDIPICIEAESSDDLILLRQMGEAISRVVVEISSQKRAKIHLAAVFVNNFVNYLYTIGDQILTEEEISFDVLKPLIRETAEKIQTLSPDAAQTGPAKRNDRKTIEKHLELLESSPNKEVYTMLTQQLRDHWNDSN